MERDTTNPWRHFSLEELLTMRVNSRSATGLRLAVDLHGEIARRYAEQDEAIEEATYRTKSGRVLTDADIKALADEAERGYDVDHLVKKRESQRRLEEDETNVADGYLQAAVEAARMADAGETSEGVIARRAETKALRNAVWAIIQHLQERP